MFTEDSKVEVQRWSDIKGTSACYIWSMFETSISLAYIVTMGREVLQMPKFYKHTKWQA
jgi:hypothetical protein